MNIVLTGATGFLGSYILRALITLKHFVIILKRSTSNCYRICDLLQFVKCIDIDSESINNAFSAYPIDAVIHAACMYGKNDEKASLMVDTNVRFPLVLVEIAIAHRVKLFINTDTFFNNSKMKPEYMQSYILTKKHIADWLQYYSRSINVVNLKAHHIYGPKDNPEKFISWFLLQLNDNTLRVPLTEGRQIRDFVYVEDVVSAFLVTLDKYCTSIDFDFFEFEVGSGNVITLKYFLQLLHTEYCIKFPSCKSILDFGAVSYKKGELMYINSNITKLKSIGWSPKVSIHEGIKKIISTCEGAIGVQNGNIKKSNRCRS